MRRSLRVGPASGGGGSSPGGRAAREKERPAVAFRVLAGPRATAGSAVSSTTPPTLAVLSVRVQSAAALGHDGPKWGLKVSRRRPIKEIVGPLRWLRGEGLMTYPSRKRGAPPFPLSSGAPSFVSGWVGPLGPSVRAAQDIEKLSDTLPSIGMDFASRPAQRLDASAGEPSIASGIASAVLF
jgi:hypothetical protein